MKDLGIVYGSEAQAKPLIVGKDTVYVHTNIIKVETDNDGNVVDNLYKYNEIQYGKDEYIQLMSEQNQELESTLDYILTEVLPTMGDE